MRGSLDVVAEPNVVVGERIGVEEAEAELRVLITGLPDAADVYQIAVAAADLKYAQCFGHHRRDVRVANEADFRVEVLELGLRGWVRGEPLPGGGLVGGSMDEGTGIDGEGEREVREVRKLFVREASPIVTGRLSSVGRKRVHVAGCGHRRIVIALHDAGTVFSDQVHTRGGVGVVSDDVTETVNCIDPRTFDSVKGTIKGFKIRMNVGQKGNSHK